MQWWYRCDKIYRKSIEERERKVCLPKEGALGKLSLWKKWIGWIKRIKYELDCSDDGVGNGFGCGLGHCRHRWGKCKIGN